VKRLGLALALLGLVLAAVPASAKPARSRPQGPAAVRFAKDFPALKDSEWGFRLGGFGGVRRGAPLHHVPVVFVHGNNVDAADWYPVRDDFRKAGWSDQELWALSYNGLGGSNGTALHTANPERDQEHQRMGKDAVTYITEDDVNVPDLYAFITAVRRYTGSQRFSIVGHSLGVTLARETLRVHPELRQDLVAFVGIAGANHGTSFCPPGSEGNVVSCDEIAAGTPWLARLNAAGQTYGPAHWMTVYDGTGEGDPAYVGPTYAQSPALKGALNVQYPHMYHNDLRIDAEVVAMYRRWIERYATLPSSAATK
jgi:pimeloyl-ACP methyl ester carboxylesterase